MTFRFPEDTCVYEMDHFLVAMATSYAQSTNRCADLARFQMPGATIEITRAEIVAEGQTPGGREGPGPMHGGKLIFYHGVSDPWFSAKATIDYYQRMTAANGGASKVTDWSCLFLSPGMGHCGGGNATLDNLGVDLGGRLLRHPAVYGDTQSHSRDRA